MGFLIAAVVFMAASVLLVQRVAQHFGLAVDRRALALCAVMALIVNFSAILLSVYLTFNHLLMLVFMVIPMIYFVVGLLPLIKPDLDTQIMDIIDVIKSYVLYIPAFAPDLALLQIGGGGYSFSVFGCSC